jgi:hypothetical protein
MWTVSTKVRHFWCLASLSPTSAVTFSHLLTCGVTQFGVELSFFFPGENVPFGKIWSSVLLFSSENVTFGKIDWLMRSCLLPKWKLKSPFLFGYTERGEFTNRELCASCS